MDNRANILKWYPFKEKSKVLEIYEGDTILDKINKNIEIEQVSIRDMKIEGQYDYITLIGTYEYAPIVIKSYVEFLKVLKQHLKENGKILLAIDNRIGVKYLSGAKSKCYSRIFEGIEGKIDHSKTNLLLKNELIKFIEAAEFKNYKFYYPLPDYTETCSIFTDDFLPEANNSKIVYPLHYDEGSNIIYNEINVLKQICDINQFTNFTNSYFIEISNEEIENDIKFVNYNIFRKEKYQLMLIMHKNYVEKVAENDLAREHIKQISEYTHILKNMKFNVLEDVDDEKIKSEFIKEEELDKKIINLIRRGNVQEGLDEIRNWYNYIKERLEIQPVEGKDIFEKYSIEIKNKENMHFIKDGFIDLTFENIFCKDGYLFYDQEWRFENIPIEFILYRAINNLYNYNWKELQQKIAKEKILSEFKIIDFVPYFEQLENKIQEEILNQKAIQEQTNKMKSYYKTIEEFQKDIAQKEQKILEMQEEYKILDSDNKKTIIEKEYIEKQYRDLLHEYETSRGWKVIKGIRKILGRK